MDLEGITKLLGDTYQENDEQAGYAHRVCIDGFLVVSRFVTSTSNE